VSSFIQTPLADRRIFSKRGRFSEDLQMWLYILTWLPLLTIALTAAISSA
jgi:hypothetical protein